MTPEVINPKLPLIDALEEQLLTKPEVIMPCLHFWADGIYWRELHIPAGTIAIGHAHKTEHINVLLTGKVRVLCDGAAIELKAPYVFKTQPGVRKLVLALEDTRWVNIHANPDNTTDLELIEARYVKHSPAFQRHAAELKKLQESN